MIEIKCPNSLPTCDKDCGYYSEKYGVCSVRLLAEKKAEEVDMLGALKRKSKKVKG